MRGMAATHSASLGACVLRQRQRVRSALLRANDNAMVFSEVKRVLNILLRKLWKRRVQLCLEDAGLFCDSLHRRITDLQIEWICLDEFTVLPFGFFQVMF